MKSMKLKIMAALIFLLLPRISLAEACPYITRPNLEAIDAALPCVNFTDVDGVNPNSSLQSDLRQDLRQGVYSDLVARNQMEAGCRASLISQKVNNSAEMERVYDEIADRFVHYRQAFRHLREAGARDQQLTDITINSTPRGEPGATAANGALRGMQGMRDSTRDAQRDQLIARIPYGNEPYVADAIRQLDIEMPENFPQNREQVNQFKQKILTAFGQTQRAYTASNQHFQSLWRETNCAIQTPQGVSTLGRVIGAIPSECPAEAPRAAGPLRNASEWRTCNCPSGYTSVGGTYAQEDGTWRALSRSGSINSYAEDVNHPIANLQGILRRTVTCNADRYAAEQEALSSFGIVAGVASLVPGIGPLVVVGVSSLVYGQQIMNACYGGQATGFRVVNGTSCTDGLGLQSAIQAADSTDCGAAVLNLVGATAFSGAVASTRRVLSGAEGILGGRIDDAARVATSGFADAGGAGARTLDDATAAGTAARTGERATGGGTRRVTGTGAGDDAGRTAGRGADSADDAARASDEAVDVLPTPDIPNVSAAERARLQSSSLPDRLPSNSRGRRLVEDNRTNPEVRLTDDQERLISEETFARKREIDELIGGRPGRDIHQDHAELNRYLEGPGSYEENINRYIQARGFTGDRARRLRESVEILQRERTVLTRTRVNRDLDAARAAGAEVRTVPCGGVNSLNDTLAFHDRAKCSVIRFTRAVENYCACGGRGSLGSWAGPCAQAFEDYLTSDQLADRDALPGDSARGLRECRRIRIPANTVVVHGGLRPTMSGHGGAAQLFLPTRALAPRAPRGSAAGTPPSTARLDETRAVREEELGISDADITGAPQIEAIAVAPLHPSRELTEVFNAGRICRQNPNGCSSTDVASFTDQFNRYARRHPNEINSEQRQQFAEWADWLRNCRPIQMGGDSSFGAYDRFRPGCRGN